MPHSPLRPQGAFGVRQLAAAFGLPVSRFQLESCIRKRETRKRATGYRESGSKLPHSKGARVRR
jgi:hypothetical protein